MQRSASSLEGALLNRAWIQWAALGVNATVERDEAVVDPEALIAPRPSSAIRTRVYAISARTGASRMGGTSTDRASSR